MKAQRRNKGTDLREEGEQSHLAIKEEAYRPYPKRREGWLSPKRTSACIPFPSLSIFT